MWRVLQWLGACAVVVGSANAQIVFFHQYGQYYRYAVFCEVATNFDAYWTGDLDGDGQDDVAVQEWDHVGGPPNLGCSGTGGQWIVLSGRRQTALPLTGGIGVGDVNGDGFNDLALTYVNWSASFAQLLVRSGADDAVVLDLALPGTPQEVSFLGPVGDLDVDGCDDVLLVGDFYVRGTNTSLVVSGRTGAVLRAYPGYEARAAGDVDDDGVPDIAVTAPEVGGTPAAVVIESGRDRSILWTFTQQVAGDGFGWRVAEAGDVDGDGHGDVVVRSRTEAVVYSGRTGGVLHTIAVSMPLHLAEFEARTPLGDIDGDGFDDLALNAGLYSGASGAPISVNPQPVMGPIVYAGIGDLNADGQADFAEAVRRWIPFMVNQISLMTLSAPRGASRILRQGAGCPTSTGTIPRMSFDGHAEHGAVLSIRVHGAAPSSALALHIGDPVTIGLDPIGMPGCTLYSAPWLALPHAADGLGMARFDWAIDAGVVPLGTELNLQWAGFDPGANALGVVLSDALSVRVGT